LSNPLIEVRGLTFGYGEGAAALKEVDFRLEQGENVALLGPNGSGKTTFILHLIGLLEGAGSIEVCGMRMAESNIAAIRRKIGVVFQDSESQLFMPTVLEDVAFGPLNSGLDNREALHRALHALQTVGMEAAAERPPYHLSAGEKKRVAIAGILATKPEILALDEPTTFLDPPGQRSLAGLLSSLPQAKIIVTHNIPFALSLCTRAVFFQEGRIVANGPVAEIVRRFGWEPAATAPGSESRA
jgi:cobalt/nickel transport system ATP-binding protein